MISDLYKTMLEIVFMVINKHNERSKHMLLLFIECIIYSTDDTRKKILQLSTVN